MHGSWSAPVNLPTLASYYALSGARRTVLTEDDVFRLAMT
jgi:hypothetical protein